MKVFIGPNGTIRNLLDEDDPVEPFLSPPSTIERFSNVETKAGTADWYILIPGKDPVGPFPTRKEALRVEHSLAEAFLLGPPAGV